MAVPKRRTSKSRLRSRKASHRTKVYASQPCANCGAAKEPHRICNSCGYYKGRQVLTIEAD